MTYFFLLKLSNNPVNATIEERVTIRGLELSGSSSSSEPYGSAAQGRTQNTTQDKVKDQTNSKLEHTSSTQIQSRTTTKGPIHSVLGKRSRGVSDIEGDESDLEGDSDEGEETQAEGEEHEVESILGHEWKNNVRKNNYRVLKSLI